jgi:hypothetical protein
MKLKRIGKEWIAEEDIYSISVQSMMLKESRAIPR